MSTKAKKSLLSNEGVKSLISSLISILFGLIFGFFVMMIFKGPEAAVNGMNSLLFGLFDIGTYGTRGIGTIFYFATPIIMTGLSVGFSFKTGVFNIGVIGQFTMGSVAAILVGGLATFIPEPIHWVVALLAGGVVGMLWALIPGLLKAYYNINEVITTIMMNYIAMYAANELIRILYYNRTEQKSKQVHKSAIIPSLGLDQVFPNSNLHMGIFLAVIFCVIIYIVLYKTGYGYGLRAVGFNRFASNYAGINERRNIISVMLIAGLIAGLGGGLYYLSSTTKNYVISEVLSIEGGYGIPVALLGMSHPIGVIFSGIFIAFLNTGGTYVQGAGFPIELAEVIIAVIIYFSAFSLLFKNVISKRLLKRKGGDDNSRQDGTDDNPSVAPDSNAGEGDGV